MSFAYVMYFIHINGTFILNTTYMYTTVVPYQMYKKSNLIFYILLREIYLMYKVPGLTHMLNILDKISMGVTLDINKNASK